MKRFKFLIFLFIFPTIFFLIYCNSNKNGFKRLRVSFRIAVVASLASLNFEVIESTETTKPSLSNRRIVHERLVLNNEFKE